MSPKELPQNVPWDVEKGKLANGLSYFLHHMPGAIATASHFGIKAGPRYITAELSAIPHAFEHLAAVNALGFGSYAKVQDAFEERGGHHEEHTTEEIVGAETLLFPRYNRFGLEYYRSLYFGTPVLPKNIAAEKNILETEKYQGMDEPSQRLEESMNTFMWPGSGLGYGVDGSLESIQQQLTVKNFLQFRNQLRADKSQIKVAGGFDVSEMREGIREIFDDLPNPNPTQTELLPPSYIRGDRGVFVEPFDSDLVYILLKFQINPQYLINDYDLNLLLVSMAGRQAYDELVNKLGKTYSIAESMQVHEDFGTVEFETATKPEFVETVTRALVGSINNLQTDKETVRKRIGGLKREHLLELDAPASRIEFMENFPDRNPNQVEANLDDLENQDITAGKERLFTTFSAAMGVLGPVSANLVPVLDEMLQFDNNQQKFAITKPKVLVP